MSACDRNVSNFEETKKGIRCIVQSNANRTYRILDHQRILCASHLALFPAIESKTSMLRMRKTRNVNKKPFGGMR